MEADAAESAAQTEAGLEGHREFGNASDCAAVQEDGAKNSTLSLFRIVS